VSTVSHGNNQTAPDIRPWEVGSISTFWIPPNRLWVLNSKQTSSCGAHSEITDPLRRDQLERRMPSLILCWTQVQGTRGIHARAPGPNRFRYLNNFANKGGVAVNFVDFSR
jgi:hypothetical protein